MKHKKTIKIAIMGSVLLLIIYVFTVLKGKEESDYMNELTADGEGMVHTVFNEKNQPAMHLRCKELEWESRDKCLMTGIQATILKKGKMNKDITIEGDKGYAENNNNDFFVEQNAKLVSEDFTITSKNFTLENKINLKTDKKVNYETKGLKGVARKGIMFFLEQNVLKFFNARGHYHRDNRDFNFKSDVLWVIDKDKWLVMEKNAVIKEANSILRSAWISLRFTDEFERIREASSEKQSYLYIQDPETEESKEIKCTNLTSYYNESGQLIRILVAYNGEILLKSKEAQTLIMSNLIEINLDGESGHITHIKIPQPGQVENTGKTKFRVSADTINADYNRDGELKFCQGEGNAQFNIEEYTGKAEKISYSLKKNLIHLEGEQATINNGGNNFSSTKFQVETEKKILSSQEGVKSVLVLDKKNVLFTEDPVFINAKAIKIFEKENKFTYKQKIHLLQNEIKLSGQDLEITDDNNILINGKVNLSFKSEEKEITINGDQFIFNAPEKTIEINYNAAIKCDETNIKANNFTIQFNDKNEISDIFGEGDIIFLKDKLRGKSGKVKWQFKEETVVLMDMPHIVKVDGGKTLGKELKIDLKTNKITILSSQTERTETVIE
jgi:lipopolysaccharide export system protein LptA